MRSCRLGPAEAFGSLAQATESPDARERKIGYDDTSSNSKQKSRCWPLERAATGDRDGSSSGLVQRPGIRCSCASWATALVAADYSGRNGGAECKSASCWPVGQFSRPKMRHNSPPIGMQHCANPGTGDNMSPKMESLLRNEVSLFRIITQSCRLTERC